MINSSSSLSENWNGTCSKIELCYFFRWNENLFWQLIQKRVKHRRNIPEVRNAINLIHKALFQSHLQNVCIHGPFKVARQLAFEKYYQS